MSDWEAGWDEGHAEGFIAGRCSGYKDGFAEGKVNGKREANDQFTLKDRALRKRTRILNALGLGAFIAGYGFCWLINWITEKVLL